MRPFTYARRTPDELFDQDALVRLANQPSQRSYEAQLFGLIGWSAYLELARLRCPTLVMHGKEDRLIMPANAQVLANRIQGAELMEVDDASHWLMTDQNRIVVSALSRHITKHS